jgi:hypothetical protein
MIVMVLAFFLVAVYCPGLKLDPRNLGRGKIIWKRSMISVWSEVLRTK